MGDGVKQHDLPQFADADAKKLARASHPETSHEAAQDVVQSGQVMKFEKFALSMVTKYPGRTANELEDIAGVKGRVIGRRLDGLRKKQQIQNGEDRICTITNKKCQTWHPYESVNVTRPDRSWAISVINGSVHWTGLIPDWSGWPKPTDFRYTPG